MKADGGQVIAVADHWDHLPIAPGGAVVDHLLPQRLGNALAGAFGMQVNRVLNCEAIGGPYPVWPGGGIAKQFTGRPWQPRKDIRYRARHRAARLYFLICQAVQDMLGIDRLDRGHVIIADGLDFHALGQILVHLDRQATRPILPRLARAPAWAATALPKALNKAW